MHDRLRMGWRSYDILALDLTALSPINYLDDVIFCLSHAIPINMLATQSSLREQHLLPLCLSLAYLPCSIYLHGQSLSFLQPAHAPSVDLESLEDCDGWVMARSFCSHPPILVTPPVYLQWTRRCRLLFQFSYLLLLLLCY